MLIERIADNSNGLHDSALLMLRAQAGLLRYLNYRFSLSIIVDGYLIMSRSETHAELRVG